MFGLLSGNASVFAGRRDPSQVKSAPPLPTPIRFPSISLADHEERHLSEPRLGDLEQHVAQVRKPQDLELNLLRLVNLVPVVEPNVEPIRHPVEGTTSSKLHNGRPIPGAEELELRKREVTISNESGYSALAGKPRSDPSIPRLAHLRRFWEGLDSMATYWDTSIDEYLPPNEATGVECASSPDYTLTVSTKRARTDPPSPRPNNNGGEQQQNDVRGKYRGHRMSNGANMPDCHRLDTVRAFLEPIIWPFGLNIQPPRKPPLLQIGNIFVPVRLSYSVWRIPKERERAQARWAEGPVLGVSCRHETNFTHDSVESTVDVLQEITALLLLAQERARQGKTEKKPGDGKWWTTAPRWGGGGGGEPREATGTDTEKLGENKVPDTPGSRAEAEAMKRTRRDFFKKPDLIEIWKVVKTGVGIWDPKTDYQRIGTHRNSSTDEIYLISSLNHHISIVKMEVHRAYIQGLVDAAVPKNAEEDCSWYIPRMSRSRWFDLFSPEDRLEAMETLWRLVAWMSRVEVASDTQIVD